MKQFLILLSIGLVLVTGIALPVLTHAQDQPVINPALPAPQGRCELFEVVTQVGLVQACAGANCQVITSLSPGTEVCLRGAADNPGWSYIDLEPSNINSPVYFIANNQLRRISSGIAGAQRCQEYLVNVPVTTLYQCPDRGCNQLGTLVEFDYACGIPAAAPYEGWLIVEDSDALVDGWAILSDFRPGRSNTFALASTAPQVTPLPATGGGRAPVTIPTAQPPQPTITPAGPLVKSDNLSLCQDYHVTAFQALVRECAGLGCRAVDRLDQNEVVCVRGRSENPEWFIVDLQPELTEGPLYAMNQSVIALGAEPTPPPRPFCDIFEVETSTGVNARQCPSLTCPVVDTLAQGEWICVFEYGGQFTEWVRGDIPNGEFGVWVFAANLRERVDLGGATPTPQATTAGKRFSTIKPEPFVPQRREAVPEIGTPVPAIDGRVVLELVPQDDPESGDGQQEDPTAEPTPQPTPIEPVVGTGGNLQLDVLLSALRIRNLELFSPIASADFRFTIPDNWTPNGVNTLFLNLEYVERLDADVEATDLVTFLSIYLDDVLVSNVRLDGSTIGNQTVEIALPTDILASTTRRNHVVDILLRAEDHCELNSEAQVFIRSDQSFFRFNYAENVPVLDFALYPRPFYNNPLPGNLQSVVLVLPDNPGSADLTAAASIVSGLGFLTRGGVPIETTTVSNLTPAQQQNQNLILVGKPDANALIADFHEQGILRTTVDEDNNLFLDDGAVVESDGVLQLILHPTNQERAVMVVTSNSDTGLVKAAQALGGPPSLLSLGGPVIVVSETRTIQVAPLAENYKADRTLAELGFDNLVLDGLGRQVAFIDFVIPSGYTITEDAYIELKYNYSELIGNNETFLALTINEFLPIGSRILGDLSTNAEENTLRVRIPPAEIISGALNTLQVVLDIDGEWECEPPEPDLAWFTIDPNSVLSLPITPLDPTQADNYVGDFPGSFIDRIDLRDVWVSMPDEPTIDDISQAMQMVNYMASTMITGEGMVPTVQVGNDLPEGVDLGAYNILVIGRPTTNSFLASLTLPQPFADGTDQLEQTLDDVVYRLPEGYGIGLLQTLPSPWNPSRRVMVVSGTDAISQAVAVDAVVSGRYDRAEFLGNVVFVGGTTVSAVDTNLINPGEPILEEGIQEVETTTALLQQTPTTPPTTSFTSTPGPTITPTPSFTPSVSPTPTSIFTATPTIASPTPIPTFAPLGEADTAPVEVEPPPWIDILLAATGVVLGLAVLFGIVQFFRWLRSSSV